MQINQYWKQTILGKEKGKDVIYSHLGIYVQWCYSVLYTRLTEASSIVYC